MQRATLGKSGSEAASQLQGRIARAFSSNILVNTMEMTAAIQHILTAAQSLGSQNYSTKSRMTILGLAGVLFCKHEQVFGCLGKLGLKATVGNRVTTRLSLYHIVFCSFLFLSTRVLFP